MTDEARPSPFRKTQYIDYIVKVSVSRADHIDGPEQIATFEVSYWDRWDMTRVLTELQRLIEYGDIE